MANESHYHVSLDSAQSHSRSPKVGLLRDLTGVPVFLLYLMGRPSHTASVCPGGTENLDVHSFVSSKAVEEAIFHCDNPMDKAAWEALLPFFDGDGTRAIVLTLPRSGAPRNLLTEMIGRNGTLGRRSGIYRILDVAEYADLVVVPQASQCLDENEHRAFYTKLDALCEESGHFFALIDFPLSYRVANCEKYLKGLDLSSSACFFPWIYRDSVIVPPASLAAGHIQKSDRLYLPSDPPCNRPIDCDFSPCLKVPPSQTPELLRARINLIDRFPDQTTRLWGASTLALTPSGYNDSIASLRTSRLLTEALESLCESFVLEPLNSELPSQVNVTIDSRLRELNRLFDPDATEPFILNTEVREEKGEEILSVTLEYRLPTQTNHLSLSVNLAA